MRKKSVGCVSLWVRFERSPRRYGQRGLEHILESPEVTEVLVAASILWKYWNHELEDMAISPPGILKLDAKLSELEQKLESIGLWSELIAKYGTHWIKELFSIQKTSNEF